MEIAGFREQRHVGTLPLSSTFSKEVAFNIIPEPVVKWSEVYDISRRVGFEFELMPKEKWLDMLRDSDANPYANTTIKLLDFFQLLLVS